MSTEQEDFGDLKAAFAAALRVEMVRKGIDQRRLAASTGLSVGTVSNYWNGATVPRLIDLARLCRALGIGQREFYERIMDEYDRLNAVTVAQDTAGGRGE